MVPIEAAAFIMLQDQLERVLDKLAEHREVIVPSLPGYPGATGHAVLDSHLDWVLAVRHLLGEAGLAGADIAGSSVSPEWLTENAPSLAVAVGLAVRHIGDESA